MKRMTELPRVQAVPAMVDGQAGYDLRVNDQAATVQDYLEAVQSFSRSDKCYRSRRPEAASCLGCDLCCRERVPVTLIDALQLAGGDIGRTIEDLLHVFVEGRVVDITMGLDETGGCRLLDRTRGICKAYQQRPLVCRTFICCPSTRNARQLRSAIVNAGEDELVRTWFNLCSNRGQLIIHEAVSPQPQPADYPPTPFTGALKYEQVKLKDICSPGLWRRLTKRGF